MLKKIEIPCWTHLVIRPFFVVRMSVSKLHSWELLICELSMIIFCANCESTKVEKEKRNIYSIFSYTYIFSFIMVIRVTGTISETYYLRNSVSDTLVIRHLFCCSDKDCFEASFTATSDPLTIHILSLFALRVE